MAHDVSRTKAKRQMSRRPIVYNRPFEAIHWDLIHHVPSLARTPYLLHSVDPVTKYQFGDDIGTKDQCAESLFAQIEFIRTQFNLTVLTIHADNETALIPSLSSEARSRGLNLELSPPYTPEQNPFAERYGALISAMSRQMVEDTGLPSYLWPEAARTSIYIQNHIPHRSPGWQSPSEALASYLGDRAPHWLQAEPDLQTLGSSTAKPSSASKISRR